MSATDEHISYHPTEGLTYDPEDPPYWDPAMLALEIRRAFEICQGCRMCFKFCDSFPTLFKLVDDTHEGDVGAITKEETQQVMDACFQCKLCEVQCPYTPRDQHEFQLDFPKLVHRHDAIEARKNGLGFRDRILADPDGSGRLARASFGLANVMNRATLHRLLMEKVLGIHRDKLLPDFASKTFERWAEQTGHVVETPGTETVLFQTCYVQNNEPQIGRDVLEVLEKNQVSCGCVQGLECCGMPAWEHGDLETLRARARVNLSKLLPHVEAGAKVLVINPTCGMMLRREYPELVAEADRADARRVAEAVRDVGEFLWSIRKEARFNTNFKSTPGKVSYHAPCHLRAQAVGFKGRDLLKKIPGVKPTTVMECCGHDGTYAMKVEGFEVSQRVGEKAFSGMTDANAEVWATECPLAAVQFDQFAGRKAMHPMSVLARAYREDGFPTRVGQDEKGS